MTKNLKLNIKNTQIAKAINLSGLKGKLGKKKAEGDSSQKDQSKEEVKKEGEEPIKEESPRIRARSKSAFAEAPPEQTPKDELIQETAAVSEEPLVEEIGKEEFVEEQQIASPIIEPEVAEEPLRAGPEIVESPPFPSSPRKDAHLSKLREPITAENKLGPPVS